MQLKCFNIMKNFQSRLKSVTYFILFIILFLSCSKTSSPPTPVVSFTWASSNLTAPSTVTFTNTSTNATAYSWDFGDGSNSTAASPTHIYATGGSYIAKLTVTGEGGTNSSTQTVNIVSPTALQITVKDNLGNAVVGASVKLYSSVTDYNNGTNQLLTTQVSNASGVVTFSPLSAIKYYWLASSSCQNNIFGSNTTTSALTTNITTSVTTIIAGTGTLTFSNISSNPYDVYINGALQITNMAGGTTQSYTAAVGSYSIRVLQKSGYLVFPTDKTYSVTLACGGSLTTTFP